MPNETDEKKIKRVANEIQELLVRNRCALIPTLSIQVAPPEKHIITPGEVNDFIKP